MDAEELSDWFEREVMPLEGLLEGYLRRNWRDRDEVPDLRQEVYARVYDSAARGLPESTQAFVLSTARHLLVDRARRARIVSIETFADLDALAPSRDELSPERHLSARSELRLLQAALDLLPALCREVVALRKIEDVPQREVAERLGIKEEAVERLVAKGVRALGEALRAGLQGRRADDGKDPGKSPGKGASQAPSKQGRSTP
ncbi:sigma-70 family RNA polymerase sigma factor [Roseateles sp.]|uniref:RNA polymerase sigma factor n=1 Tax=Roseateles sp. TaxID=1971397 RepID=UPI0031E1B577